MLTKEPITAKDFSWNGLGDIDVGRPNLGPKTEVAMYRLLQLSLRKTLIENFGEEKTSELFRSAGFKAGVAFSDKYLDPSLDFQGFIGELYTQLREQGVGILRFEESDVENLKFVLTVAEDLDCSGLPVTDETVCEYDEGFISGVLGFYTGHLFRVEEVDCWASGGRVCRFEVEPA